MLNFVTWQWILTFIYVMQGCVGEGSGSDCVEDGTHGGSYNGSHSSTLSGLPCLYWNSTTVQSDQYVAENQHLFENVRENYCINPDSDAAPWCFVDAQGWKTFEYCNIDFCSGGSLYECSEVTATLEETQSETGCGSLFILTELLISVTAAHSVTWRCMFEFGELSQQGNVSISGDGMATISTAPYDCFAVEIVIVWTTSVKGNYTVQPFQQCRLTNDKCDYVYCQLPDDN